MEITTTPALLSAQLTGSVSEAKPSKLHDAAHQFEALMMGEILKSARESNSDGWLGGGETTGDDSAMDMAEAQFAQALAAGGGLGLAKLIEQTMDRRGDVQHNTAVAADVSVSSKQ